MLPFYDDWKLTTPPCPIEYVECDWCGREVEPEDVYYYDGINVYCDFCGEGVGV